MSALFDPARHEALEYGLAWDEARARATLRAIVSDAEQARSPDGAWPVHPLDEEGTLPRGGFKSLYFGAAGVIWALWYLQREGAATLAVLDPAAAIAQADAAYRADPDTGEVVPSYYLGEVGILLVRWAIAREAPVAERLFAAVAANIDNPTNEALWAAPGTMGAAWHLWQATGEARWRTLFLDNVARLWRTWRWADAAGCHVWTQDLYGSFVQYLGAGHGFAGNVYPLLKGAALLDEAQRDELYARCAATLTRAALREGDAVNWPPGLSTPRPGRPAVLVQWCHGAPGVVTALADYPAGRSSVVDTLLLGAGETVWRAGALAKGPGLCHGTAGNGYALLKLHRRSGDARWLERARAFAMHAIGQYERAWREHGRGRYSLWTGDVGLAVYLWHCIGGQADLPALDII